MSKYDLLWLPDRSEYCITCPKCGTVSNNTRADVSRGFSYLEKVKGMQVECAMCKAKLTVADDFMYGYVLN